MVRRFPTTDDNPIIHPEISLSLLVAGMVATIAMITTLCGVRSRRQSPPSSPTATAARDEAALPTTTPPPATTNPPAGEGETNGEQIMLPLPPKMQQVGESTSPSPSPIEMSKSASERRLKQMKSMSMKVPRSLSFVKNHLEEGRQRRKEKMKGEESIWKKTIILGEKCKVSEEEEDGVIYEGKGKKISAYHPRAHSVMSISMSRQGSAIDADALHSPPSK